jgi:transketolase
MESREQTLERLAASAKRMRGHALAMALKAGPNGAHLGPGLSIIEITATLYGAVMKFDPGNPHWEDRDRFILSKGHGTLGTYTALFEAGLISAEDLDAFEANGGDFPGQPAINMDKGIEFCSGSLGHGLSLGVGVALSGKRRGKDYRTYVLMGDGECNEGTVWEAAMAASHFALGHLIAVIDRNNLQSDGPTSAILDMKDLASKWRSFGWEVVEIDGHDLAALYDAFAVKNAPDKPRAVIAHTVKGKGVSFMENNNEWHHSRLSQEQYQAAMAELDEVPAC